MGLLADFKAAAVARTRFPDDERLTAPALFALVRDMPYEPPTDIRPGTVIAEWRATAPGKHLLLQGLYEEFGYGAMLIAALHEFRAEAMPWLPDMLRAHLIEGPIPDLHMFVRLHIGADWMTIDATWPLSAASLGMPVNERFEAGREMVVACDPDEVFHVPPDVDPVEFEQYLLERHVGPQRERRDRFIAEMSAWLMRELAATPQHGR
jgi:hypothetical protein